MHCVALHMAKSIIVFVLATVITLFFFNDTATTEIYTLSLHDALPICAACCAPTRRLPRLRGLTLPRPPCVRTSGTCASLDRKSTRLNSSHSQISYAVFCLKKKNIDSIEKYQVR